MSNLLWLLARTTPFLVYNYQDAAVLSPHYIGSGTPCRARYHPPVNSEELVGFFAKPLTPDVPDVTDGLPTRVEGELRGPHLYSMAGRLGVGTAVNDTLVHPSKLFVLGTQTQG